MKTIRTDTEGIRISLRRFWQDARESMKEGY